MGETEGEGIAEVLGVGKASRTHQGFRYLTEVRRMEGLRRMAAFLLPTLLTKQSNPLGRVRARTFEVFGRHYLHHPDLPIEGNSTVATPECILRRRLNSGTF